MKKSSSTPDVSGWRVLAVDDEPDNLAVIGDLLELVGAKVLRVPNGEDALASLATFRPTLVLLDLQMPHIDGWQVHRRIRTHPEMNDVPVVALTALAMVGDKAKVQAAGFDGYIAKPFRVHEILAALADIVAAKAARRIPPGEPPGAAP